MFENILMRAYLRKDLLKRLFKEDRRSTIPNFKLRTVAQTIGIDIDYDKFMMLSIV